MLETKMDSWEKRIELEKELIRSQILAPILTKFEIIESRFDNLEQNLNTKISNLEQNLETKILSVEQNLETKILSVEQNLETKILSVEQNLETKILGLDNKFNDFKFPYNILIGSLAVSIFGISISFATYLLSH